MGLTGPSWVFVGYHGFSCVLVGSDWPPCAVNSSEFGILQKVGDERKTGRTLQSLAILTFLEKDVIPLVIRPRLCSFVKPPEPLVLFHTVVRDGSQKTFFFLYLILYHFIH